VGDDPLVVVPATVLVVGLSAFFVAVEFALLGAKRHRLEDAAGTAAGRAALRSSHELTLLLAGSQLGITVCTLALGAISKPAVHHWLTPAFEGLGVPAAVADVAGFVLALFVVTFVHLVVGEMAPKSWAIAHPERAALLLALPMRAFTRVFRPVLTLLNSWANALVRAVGVEPVDEVATAHTPETLRHLLEHSSDVGALDARFSAQLSGALDLERLAVRDLLRPGAVPACVPGGASVGDVREVTRRTGHLRVLLGTPQEITGVVHVRDTLTEPGDAATAPFARPVFVLDAATPVYEALARMRETRHHLAVVLDGGRVEGVVTMADVLRRLFPRPVPVGGEWHDRSGERS
jgi:CBS domain containing-hemolysin-like protein